MNPQARTTKVYGAGWRVNTEWNRYEVTESNAAEMCADEEPCSVMDEDWSRVVVGIQEPSAIPKHC